MEEFYRGIFSSRLFFHRTSSERLSTDEYRRFVRILRLTHAIATASFYKGDEEFSFCIFDIYDRSFIHLSRIIFFRDHIFFSWTSEDDTACIDLCIPEWLCPFCTILFSFGFFRHWRSHGLTRETEWCRGIWAFFRRSRCTRTSPRTR